MEHENRYVSFVKGERVKTGDLCKVGKHNAEILVKTGDAVIQHSLFGEEESEVWLTKEYKERHLNNGNGHAERVIFDLNELQVNGN